MKKSELHEFIKSEILNELSSTTEDTQQDIKDTEELTKAVQDLSTAKQTAGLSEENIGLADLGEMGYDAGVEAFNMADNANYFQNSPDFKAFKKGFFQGFIDQSSSRGLSEGYEDQGFESEDEMEDYYLNLDSVDENGSLNEMAKIVGDLKSSIEKVIQNNPDLEMSTLKKTIKSDKDVITALGDNPLYDTQLSKFVSAAKGDREIGQRGRKVNPNTIKRPKSPTGSVGRPRKSKDEKESKTVASKLNKSVTTIKGDEPTASDIKQAIGFARKGKKDLQVQEKRKMVKSFVADMKQKGIISPNGKIEDREKYNTSWNIAKEKIENTIKGIR